MDALVIAELLEKVRAGDRVALGQLLDGHRAALLRVLSIRIDGRLRGRIDPTDIVQDVFLEASKRIDSYLAHPAMPLHLWLRYLAIQRLHAVYREHLGAQRRDARREVALESLDVGAVTSEVVADGLISCRTTPSQAAARAELRAKLVAALDSLEEIDREIIVLRHFEQLGNADAATVLGIETSAASKRYLRAMRRLGRILEGIPGMVDQSWI